MSTLLHLSDLHLGDPEPHQLIDSFRSGIAVGDRPRAQRDVLREALLALAQDEQLGRVDAVIVSGDLTNRSGACGFKEFPEVIAPLVKRVGAENVLVVPGNHDVPWEHGPDDPQRYDGFRGVTRAHGFATPLLDGIDFDAAGKPASAPVVKPDAVAATARHTLGGNDFIVVALNSSHFCWGQEPLSDEVAEELLAAPASELAQAVETFRRHDVARISNAQITRLLDMLRNEDPLLLEPEPGDTRVRIAVLHHQLLPVSAREEFKSFESLTNLGAIRELFAQLRISVVLHGHKHESALYWDYVADQRGLERPPHRILVSAAPAKFVPGASFARLIRIGERQLARDVVITDLLAPHGRAGIPAAGDIQRARLWRRPRVDAIGDAITLEGDSVGEVYAQLQSIFDGRAPSAALRDVVCTINEPADAGRVPPGYPSISAIDDPQIWMDDLVNWWRLPEPTLLGHVTFNHGERLYRRWGDQVARAAATLLSASGPTTRAVMMLLDPQTDGYPTGDFPSFVLVQLQLVGRRSRRELDCTGFFRKQEMRYWWPINVAELALVQDEVLKTIRRELGAIAGGRLRTITSYAAVENKLPTVALAAIDRAVDLHPEHLWEMAYAIVHPDGIDTAQVRRRWESYIAELEPGPDHSDESLLTSFRGIEDLHSLMKWMKNDDRPVAAALSALIGFYAPLQEQPGPIVRTKATVEEAGKRLQALRAALDAELAPLPPPSRPDDVAS